MSQTNQLVSKALQIQQNALENSQQAMADAVELPMKQSIEFQKNAAKLFLDGLEMTNYLQNRNADLTRDAFSSYITTVEDTIQDTTQLAEAGIQDAASFGQQSLQHSQQLAAGDGAWRHPPQQTGAATQAGQQPPQYTGTGPSQAAGQQPRQSLQFQPQQGQSYQPQQGQSAHTPQYQSYQPQQHQQQGQPYQPQQRQPAQQQSQSYQPQQGQTFQPQQGQGIPPQQGQRPQPQQSAASGFQPPQYAQSPQPPASPGQRQPPSSDVPERTAPEAQQQGGQQMLQQRPRQAATMPPERQGPTETGQTRSRGGTEPETERTETPPENA